MATTEQAQQSPTQSPKLQSPKQLERRANAKEEIVNATSGAREIVDHAAFNARAVGKILLHPFDKEAKAEAITKAREDKTLSDQRMAAIREVGAQQADAMRASSRRLESPEAPSEAEPVTESPPPATDAPQATEVSAAAASPSTAPPVQEATIDRD